MASFNKVILMGNLTKDPVKKYLPSGMAVADLSLAINETYKNKDGEQVENTCFVDVVVWARQAETCAEYLFKGSPVMIEGRLQLDKWKTKEGENRTKLRVRADRVQFLGSPKKGEVKDGGGFEDRAQGGSAPEEGAPAVEPDLQDAGDSDNLPF